MSKAGSAPCLLAHRSRCNGGSFERRCCENVGYAGSAQAFKAYADSQRYGHSFDWFEGL